MQPETCLAAAGFTAASDAIEHPRGFLAALSPAGQVDRASPVEAGARWRITEGLNIKRYPVCYLAHRAIDAMLAVLEANPVGADDIAAIEVHVSRTHADLLHNHRPTTPLEAKSSLEFAMAAAVVARHIGLGELAADFVRRADIPALLPRVAAVPPDERVPEMPGFAPHDHVAVHLRDGQVLLSPKVRRAKGHAERPLSSAELGEKFRANCRFGGLDSGKAEDLMATLEDLEKVSDLNAILQG